MNDDRSFSTLDWLQTIAINCLLLLLYGVAVYFLLGFFTHERKGALAIVLMVGSASAFVFNLLANFLFFLPRKVSPEAVLGVLLAVQCLVFIGDFHTMLFFWGASLINYGILAAYFRRKPYKK